MSEISIKPQQELPFAFTGKGGEYFKIWIVNMLLTIITLGVYSAWATVRTNRYFYGNTVVDQASFEYHATPLQILKSRLVALVLFIFYALILEFFPSIGAALALALFLIMPWIVRNGFYFKAFMSSYRNVRFGFSGTVKSAYWILLGLPALVILVAAVIGVGLFIVIPSVEIAGFLAAIVTVLGFYSIAPYEQKLITDYYLNNTHYGQGRFSADLETTTYYGIYTRFVLLSLAVIVIVIMVLLVGLSIALEKSGIGLDELNVLLSLNSDDAIIMLLESVVAFILPVLLVVILLGSLAFFWLHAYLKTHTRNYAYNNLQLDDVLRFESTIKTTALFKLYLINFLLLPLTLGLAHPWNRVRLARYEAATLKALVINDWAPYVNQRQAEQSALGDQLGDVFDLPVNTGLGL